MAVVDRGPAERCHLQAAAALPQALPPDMQAMAPHTGSAHTGTPAETAVSACRPSMMHQSPKAPMSVMSASLPAAVFMHQVQQAPACVVAWSAVRTSIITFLVFPCCASHSSNDITKSLPEICSNALVAGASAKPCSDTCHPRPVSRPHCFGPVRSAFLHQTACCKLNACRIGTMRFVFC